MVLLQNFGAHGSIVAAVGSGILEDLDALAGNYDILDVPRFSLWDYMRGQQLFFKIHVVVEVYIHVEVSLHRERSLSTRVLVSRADHPFSPRSWHI